MAADTTRRNTFCHWKHLARCTAASPGCLQERPLGMPARHKMAHTARHRCPEPVLPLHHSGKVVSRSGSCLGRVAERGVVRAVSVVKAPARRLPTEKRAALRANRIHLSPACRARSSRSPPFPKTTPRNSSPASSLCRFPCRSRQPTHRGLKQTRTDQ